MELSKKQTYVARKRGKIGLCCLLSFVVPMHKRNVERSEKVGDEGLCNTKLATIAPSIKTMT
jgi:hypothetical protein